VSKPEMVRYILDLHAIMGFVESAASRAVLQAEIERFVVRLCETIQRDANPNA
jgi:hypothetical protein